MAEIEGYEFTLFYDYDQLRDKRFELLTDSGKIEWFHLRMEAVFLGPMRELFNRDSVAHQELIVPVGTREPFRHFMIASFSTLLNGIEALGSFMPSAGTKGENFKGFIVKYMDSWDCTVTGSSSRFSRMLDILWKHFRNGIAHGFAIEHGGVDYVADPDPGWLVDNGRLVIGPVKFFKDFDDGVSEFFRDIQNIPSPEHDDFMKRLDEVYPCP